MTVYWEYAFVENFVLDALLLTLALMAARGRKRVINLLFASSVGAAEAIVFPLLRLPVVAAYVIKFLGGAVLPLLAVSRGTKKTYLYTEVFFFVFTFALGGMLAAVYSFFGVEYIEGNGYLIERAPIGLVLGAAGFFAVGTGYLVRALYRFKKVSSHLVPCTLVGIREVHWKGFADSGNCLLFCGKPVCVLSSAALYVLLGKEGATLGNIRISTVNGSRETKVFDCPALQIGEKTFEHVPVVAGEIPAKEYQIILHTAYTEGLHATSVHVERVAAKDEGKRKRRALPLRKRGTSAPALGGGGERAPAKIGRGRGSGEGESQAHRA